MSFDLSVSTKKEELRGDLNMAVTRHRPVSDEENTFLRDVVPEVVDVVTKDFDAKDAIGLSIVGSTDNMHTNVTITINAGHSSPAHIFKKKEKK